MEHKTWYSRGYLPHFDSPGTIQTIVFRLADSFSSAELTRLTLKFNTNPDSIKQDYIEECMHKGHGDCHLKDPALAKIVEDALLFFDDQRYRLLTWVVMPNHVHTMVEMVEGYPIADILKSWKGYSAREINKVLGRSGQFWSRDYFDRYIRTIDHYYDALNYIHMNPVIAGLVQRPEDWPFSSANRIVG